MDSHRNVRSSTFNIIVTSHPFSSFDFVDSSFGSLPSLRRCFSIARSREMRTVTVEEIPSSGIIKDENDEIASYFSGYSCESVVRIAFWKIRIASTQEIFSVAEEDMIGYAILKKDCVPDDKRTSQWHIFESVFRKYPHMHNCVPGQRKFRLKVADQIFHISGVLYCQQNQLNKACAHVALRTLIVNHLPEKSDIAYGKLNSFAGISPNSKDHPRDGLSVQEIRKILTSLEISFFDIDYKQNRGMSKSHPYQKFLYSGIESRSGALIGFHLEGPGISDKKNPPKHIIPFFGHTFNKDTWVPDADTSYFNVGGSAGYIPSENWTSSFIGHDDNFGCDFCVPRLYVSSELVDYVVELLPLNVKYSGVKAEVLALSFLYTMRSSINEFTKENVWLARFNSHIKTKKIVLRPFFISKNRYLEHLKNSKDWDGNFESPKFLKAISNLLPKNMWMIEVSIPQLFPANERKIGELLLNPYIAPNSEEKIDFTLLLLARFPSVYCFHTGTFEKNDQPELIYLKSEIKSHMPLAK